VDQLGQAGGEEEEVNGKEDGGAGRDHPQQPAPLVTGDVEEQQRSDRDRASHCHAERVGQRG
jgi:hypothetical protein